MDNSTLTMQIAQYDGWKLGLVVYETIDELFDALKNGIPDSEGSELSGETIDHEGNEGTVSEDEMRKGIINNGLWGFVEEQDAREVVHIWADLSKVTFDHLLFFFGHEVGHTIPDSELPIGDPLRDEQQADGYAFAAKEAYRLAAEVWEFHFKLSQKGDAK